jgi:teichuronic acid biosynthesis glycosyltransferase TuaG
MNELVSIVTPVYNSESYLKETFESIKKQTYSNWEWLLIDDCSQDNSRDLMKELALRDQRIKTFYLQENAGPAVARNIGISNAQGKYLTFIDSDDLWFEDFIEKSVCTITKTHIPFVFSSYQRKNEDLSISFKDFIVPNQVSYTDILKTNSISCLTAFIDIEVLGKLKMPEVRKRQDMGLWLKYLKKIPFAYGIKEPKAIYRIRENSLSRKKKDLIKHQWYFYRKVENLSFIDSLYYMIHWAIHGVKKYRL